MPRWEGDYTPDPDAQFILELEQCCGRAPWDVLNKFLNKISGKALEPIDLTESINMAKQVVHAVLRTEPDNLLRLTDRSVVEYWPVEPRQEIEMTETNTQATEETTEETTTTTAPAKTKKSAFGSSKKTDVKENDVSTAKKKAAPTKAAAKKTAPKKNAPKAERNTRSKWEPTDKITVIVDANPKREGSGAHKRFELYKKNNTVEKYLKAGGTRPDLVWDAKQKFIRIGK